MQRQKQSITLKNERNKQVEFIFTLIAKIKTQRRSSKKRQRQSASFAKEVRHQFLTQQQKKSTKLNKTKQKQRLSTKQRNQQHALKQNNK